MVREPVKGDEFEDLERPLPDPDRAAAVLAANGSQTEPIVVPDVTELTRAEAITELAESGLELDFVDVREPGSELDDVVRTDPAAGVEVDEGATLTLFVSLGEPLVADHEPETE